MMAGSDSSRGEMVRMPAGSRVDRNSDSVVPGAASPVAIFTRTVTPARKTNHGCTFFLFFMCAPLYWQCKDNGIAWYFAIHRTRFFLVVFIGRKGRVAGAGIGLFGFSGESCFDIRIQ